MKQVKYLLQCDIPAPRQPNTPLAFKKILSRLET